MKVILYMATTVNGYIAKEDDDTSFVSENEWENFRKMIKRTGNIIVGRRTYEIMKKSNEFEGLKDIKVLVVTNNPSFNTTNSNHSTQPSPKEALEFLRQQGFQEVLVAGGSKLNTSFMAENLIDEIYLDIEPLALSRGIKLFADADFEAKLELLDTKQFSPNELQLHYKVLK